MANLKSLRLASLHDKENTALDIAEKKADVLVKVEEKKLKVRKQK